MTTNLLIFLAPAYRWLRAVFAYALTLTLLVLGVQWAVLFVAALAAVLEFLDECAERRWLPRWTFLDPEGFNVFDYMVSVIGAVVALLFWSFGR
jgi:hypothetical protein